MAKKKEKVVLEDIELKPQVIGYTFKKKSNIGRVIFIFVVFILVIYYINDISVFVNNLLGKTTADTIKEQTNNKDTDQEKENDSENQETEEINYNVFSSDLVVNTLGLTLNNFSNNNNVLTFDALNDSNQTLNLSSRKLFVETYSENKTLVDRFKIDIDSITSKAKKSYTFNVSNPFYYFVISEKTKDDYPNINLEDSGTGIAKLTCNKDIDSIVYTFRDNELSEITHTISDSNITDANYTLRYNNYQNKATTYNNVNGITTTFNSSANGYTAVIAINLEETDLSNLDEKYYYAYKEEPKVVNFEMETYGFNCN